MKIMPKICFIVLAAVALACEEPSSEAPGTATYLENRTDRPIWVTGIRGEGTEVSSFSVHRVDSGEQFCQFVPFAVKSLYYIGENWDILDLFAKLSLYDDAIKEYEDETFALWDGGVPKDIGERRELHIWRYMGEGWKAVLRYKFYEYEMSTNESERLAQEVRPDGLWHVEVPTNTRPFHVVRASNLVVITGIMSNYSYTNE